MGSVAFNKTYNNERRAFPLIIIHYFVCLPSIRLFPFNQDEHDVDHRSSAFEPAVGELRPGEAEAGGLGRHLGLFSTTFLIIGRIIGTGIFSTPSSITEGVGSVGASTTVWLIGLVMSFAGLFIWIELGCMIPRSGGEKVYLEAAYKRPKLLATTVFAFQIILLGFTASGCIVFTEYVFAAANKTASEWEKLEIAIFVVSFICSMHTIFPNGGVRFMNSLGMIKMLTLTFIVITGWAVLGGSVSRIENPHASFRDAFAGTSSSLGICGVFYLLANVAYYAAATPAEVAASGVTVATLFMNNVFGLAGGQAISALIALSAFGNVCTVTFAQARVNQELAKEGAFGRFWASNWPFGSPSAGLLLHWIPSFIPIRRRLRFHPRSRGLPLQPRTTVSLLVACCGFLCRPTVLPDGCAFLETSWRHWNTPPIPYYLYSVIGIVILVAGALWWAIWCKILPAVGGYRLKPQHEKLEDGTSIVVYQKIKTR
ncbi:High-affinity methionine permease [Lachnellula suecica]|uniref:High-affinity methionine permease n=1 Tax=Lachnellula suecica TaxID=602035 RepID=A0A8T9C1R1_9HELO|nr:High-affinity methionine permease [Lachnellula suecica]